MRPLTAPNKILKILVIERGLNKYQIKKKTKLSYSRVHESVQKLEIQGLIKGKVVGKAPTGLSKKEYSLTLRGLNHVASQPQYDLDTLMENYGDILPLLARKWDFIERATKKWKIPHIYRPHFVTYEPPWDADSYAEQVLRNFLLDNYDVPPRFLNIIKAFSEDPDLKRLLHKILKERLEWFRKQSQLMDEGIHILERSRFPSRKERKKGGEK